MRYYDTKTGQKVSKAVWKRAKARGSKRYKREYKFHTTGVIIRTGYSSSRGNSFSMTVKIAPRKRLSDDDLSDLVAKLAAQGHFDRSENNPTADLQWASFHNGFEIIARDDGYRLRDLDSTNGGVCGDLRVREGGHRGVESRAPR